MRATIVLSGLLTTAACLNPCLRADAQTYSPSGPTVSRPSTTAQVEDWWAAPGNPQREQYLKRFSQRYTAPPAQFLPGYSSDSTTTQFASQTQQADPKPAPPAPPAATQTEKPATTVKPPPTTTQPQTPPEATQPATPQPSPVLEPSPLSPFTALQAPPRPFLARLSRAPDMFGDSISTNSLFINQQAVTASGPNESILVDVPSPGGFARFKNEHARAMPTDRVFVLYNHFHNALAFESIGSGTVTRNVDLVTLGAEKTFDEGRSSLEIRLPLVGLDDVNVNGAGFNAETVGDLVLALKTLLAETDNFAIAVGAALSLPTAGDVSVALGSGDTLKIRNHTVRLLPYLAFQMTPDENWFFHLYAQLDSTASANSYVYRSGGFNTSRKIADQSLFYLDWSAGYWWYRADENATGLTGLASVFELHWTTALNDAQGANFGNLPVIPTNNRFDALNATGGVHIELNSQTALRVAAVLPLRQSQDNRFFDAEAQVSLIHRY